MTTPFPHPPHLTLAERRAAVREVAVMTLGNIRASAHDSACLPNLGLLYASVGGDESVLAALGRVTTCLNTVDAQLAHLQSLDFATLRRCGGGLATFIWQLHRHLALYRGQLAAQKGQLNLFPDDPAL